MSGGVSPDRPPTGGVSDEDGGIGLTLRSLWRLLVICYQFAPLGLSLLRDRRRFLLFGGSREVTREDRRRRARYLLGTFLDLGPTFIKLGQILSTRYDALPREYIEVLSQLQDKVPPDDWSEIRPIVEDELGPVEEAFASFDTDPISGASLGQVYTAELDGRDVALKVLRPDIPRRVEADLRVIKGVLPLLVRFAPKGQAFTLENLADEFAATIREEMDYEHEARMLKIIGANFADDPKIRIPDVVDEHSTDRVLTMEYVGGTKIDDVETLRERGLDPTALVDRLEAAYIQMIVEDGVFHADPHPGNLAVQSDGTIVFYDFGMTGRLDDRTRDQLLEFYVAVARDDVDAMMDAFVAMDALDPDADRTMMAKAFRMVVDNLRGQDIETDQIQQFVSEFQTELYEFPMRLPQNLALVVRVSTVLEGVCRTLDPEFDFVEVVQEYVADRGLDGDVAEETARRVGQETVDQFRQSAEGLLRVGPRLEDTLNDLDRGSTEIVTNVANEPVFDRIAKRIVASLLFVSAGISTAILGISGHEAATYVASGAFALLGVLLYFALRGPKKEAAVRRVTQTTIQRRPSKEE